MAARKDVIFDRFRFQSAVPQIKNSESLERLGTAP